MFTRGLTFLPKQERGPAVMLPSVRRRCLIRILHVLFRIIHVERRLPIMHEPPLRTSVTPHPLDTPLCTQWCWRQHTNFILWNNASLGKNKVINTEKSHENSGFKKQSCIWDCSAGALKNSHMGLQRSGYQKLSYPTAALCTLNLKVYVDTAKHQLNINFIP